jgi:hypothetical protein
MEDLFPWLPFLAMDQVAESPLIRSFEQHLRAENRSWRTIATYLVGLRQADAFLRARGTTVETATRADLLQVPQAAVRLAGRGGDPFISGLPSSQPLAGTPHHGLAPCPPRRAPHPAG